MLEDPLEADLGLDAFEIYSRLRHGVLLAASRSTWAGTVNVESVERTVTRALV